MQKTHHRSNAENKSTANKDMRLGVQTRTRVKGSVLRAVCLFSRSSSSRPSSFALQQPNTQNWLDRVPICKWVVNMVNFILQFCQHGQLHSSSFVFQQLEHPKLTGSKFGAGKTTLCFSSFNAVNRVISTPL